MDNPANGADTHRWMQEHTVMSRCGQLDRKNRWQEIQKGLQFIQSTLPYRGTREHYEMFIKDLIWNLFGEGNDVFKEGEWTKSIEMYTEALNIADYANSEDICVAVGLLEKLYANRAAACLNIIPGLYDQALEDCEKALQLNEGNYKVLYRKAKSLNEMGRHQEAYDAVAKCSLAVPQDRSVVQLTQDLAKTLGLKTRKAYIRTKPALTVLQGSSHQDAACDKASQISSSVDEIETEVPKSLPDSSVLVPPPVFVPPLNKTAVDELPLSTSIPSEAPGFDSVSLPVSAPSPAPLAISTFMKGSRSSKSVSLFETNEDLDGDIIGNDLDDLLNQAGPETAVALSTLKRPVPLLASMPSTTSMPSPFLMPSCINPFLSSAQHCTVNLPPLYNQLGSSACFGMDTLQTLAQPRDTLESLSLSDFKTDYSSNTFMPQTQLGNSDMPMGMAVGMPEVKGHSVSKTKNPLAETHEFKQACSVCYARTVPGVLDYTLHTEEHKCKKDTLLGRLKHSPDKTWRLIRARSTKTQYVGPYRICKEVAVGKDCLYPGHCTFAYCQEEIDVWTLERIGLISRELLFDPFGPSSNIRLTVEKILQEHPEIFVFLCGVCFDHKPRIISKTNKENPSLCSHPVTKHDFEKHKCLVHILKENTVRYSKIRMLNPLCHLDLCRHEVRYGCVREDECFYAHSLIELKVWMLQHECRMSHESIVHEATTYWNSNIALRGGQFLGQRRFGPQNLKMMFVCSLCWRNGQLSEADKNKKYCSAKARHTWAKDKRVVLVSSIERKKWTTIRALPTKKPIPAQFEICLHVAAGKKCQYIGNCTFAHSVEERDLWTFMKENNIADADQLYDKWLQSQKAGWGEENANISVRENGKPIHMPTDYVEEVAGNHCWLCGKNCNSEKQWQQHITSEKHKDRVFNSEDDQNCWQYRFPTGAFKVCERFLIGTCTEDDLCKLAHSEQELREWMDRREVLFLKLAKARKDHLIAPNDNDFGKYSFLLKDE
ncbi:zinc finger CCCH domain-containing protein 7A isoform X2 [Syngnathoides biaculeatus]|uniref:zinc finger CCCH domain-containing protein 7A isoform X2 n=1 Tax=Syngnathoides biaculeatus TaxID=300417 RepID=UPI002ADD36CD|nr:zinc finger CCCH domain-containing protein 7A isoform X2 [Syngnathoides biaculeatus]